MYHTRQGVCYFNQAEIFPLDTDTDDLPSFSVARGSYVSIHMRVWISY